MFDAHVHLDFPGLNGAIERAREAGVRGFVVPGVVPEQWAQVAALELPMCVGVHPQRDVAVSAAELVTAARRFGAVGIGECGLDKRGPTTALQQETNLRAHIEAAKELQLPLVLHVVQRHGRALELLDTSTSGMVHAFVGSTEVAKLWLDRGYMLSIGPMVLRARKLREAAAYIPLDRLLLETDAPDGVPEPADLRRVLSEVAALRSESEAELASATEANARRLFNLQ